MKLSSLQDLFVEQLQDLYDAEKQILKALPKMADAASAPELQMAFQDHLEQSGASIVPSHRSQVACHKSLRHATYGQL